MISADFASELKKLLEGDKHVASRPLIVGKPSEILSKCGADIDQDITITKKVIDKAMRPEVRDEEGRLVGNTGHGLTEDLFFTVIERVGITNTGFQRTAEWINFGHYEH